MKKNKPRSSTAKNVFQLFYSTLVSSGLFALILILLANYLNTEEYAMVSVAIAISMIMGFFTDVGLSNTFLREGSKKEIPLNCLVGSYIKWRVICLLSCLLITILVIELFYGKNEGLQSILYVQTIPMITGLAMLNIGIVYYQLQERMQVVGIIRILHSLTLIILVLLGMVLKVSVQSISLLLGVSYLLGGMISISLVLKDLPLNWQHIKTTQPRLFSQIGHYFGSGILILLIPHMGPILLERTISLVEVGIFAVAFRIPSALYQLPGVIAGAFFPVLLRYYHSNLHTEHLQLNVMQIKWMGYVGMLITVPIMHLSYFFIINLFGSDWSIAGTLLAYIAPILFLQSISIALADGLTTKGLQKKRTAVQFIVFLLALFGYYFGSLSFGLAGAIGVALLIEVLSILGFWAVNPCRTVLMKQVLLAQFLIFTGTLGIILLLLRNFPFLATCCHLLLILVFMLLDKTVGNQILTHLKALLVKNKLLNRSEPNC